MKVAVVHEWLVTWAGAERVLAEILGLFPEADLFVLFDRLPDRQRANLPKDPAGETFLGRIPGVERIYRNLLPLMPSAIESLNLSSYDLVLTSSHAVAKGVPTRPGQLHLCYCHTPPRYLWDMTEAYFPQTLSGGLKKAAASLFIPRLRRWDYEAGQRPDAFMANSDFVAERISRIYGRPSTVVYPPVDVGRFVPKEKPGGEYFVTMGRLVPYKNIQRIAEAFVGLPYRLVIAGDGPGSRDLERVIRGQKNIEWLGRVTDKEWGRILEKARAFVFMAEEDFGISPVEAQAAGVPVIAWKKGGILETVRGWIAGERTEEGRGAIAGPPDGSSLEATGLFFGEPTPEALRGAIEDFVTIEDRFDPRASRANAERFSSEVFRERYGNFVREWGSRHVEEESFPAGRGSGARREGPP